MKICYTLNELDNVSNKLITKLNTKTILLYGDMGAGKTTLIKSLVKALGSHDEVSSPTFSIVNEYATKTEKIFHFDLYRLKDIEEAYNFGIEEYLNSEHWKIIEWPQLIEPILFDDSNKIYLEFKGENQRVLKLN